MFFAAPNSLRESLQAANLREASTPKAHLRRLSELPDQLTPRSFRHYRRFPRRLMSADRTHCAISARLPISITHSA
jgi:hypothetical protein